MDDLTGLGKAAEKLIGEISKGIGTLYRPRAIRKEAEAKAYETKLLGQATAEAEATRVRAAGLAEADKKLVLADVDQAILDRAKARIVVREVQRQQNIENISEEALKALPKDVSPTPISDDWRTRFFNIAEDVSDEGMQKIWGKILAGEVTQPGSYSLRALEVLRNLSKNEAEAFQRVCNLSFNPGMMIKIGVESHFKEYGVTYSDMLVLRAAGLLHDSDTLTFAFKPHDWPTPLPMSTEPESTAAKKPQKFIVLSNNGVFILLGGDSSLDFKLNVVPLTPVGLELMKLVEPNPNFEYLKRLAVGLADQKYQFKKITGIGGGKVNLDSAEDF